MERDKSNYKFGLFYYNPDDNRILVTKRIPWMGWTLNFANPLSYLAILLVVLFVIFIRFRH